MIIYGFKGILIRIRLLMTILAVSLRTGMSASKAIRTFRKIKRSRKTFHNLPPVKKFFVSDGRYFWSENIPPLPSAALNRFLKAEILRYENPEKKEIPLQTLIFAITGRCPLSCLHCYEWDNLNAREYLTLEQLFVILEKFRLEGLPHIQFSGGEPLSRFKDLLELVQVASQTMNCWILTSGFGLTERKAIALKAAGLSGVNISLDHWDPEFHNRFRNHPDSFEQARRAAENSHNAGLAVSLSLCATNDFLAHDNLYKYLELARQWKVAFVRILEPRQVGRFSHQDVSLSPEKEKMLSDFFRLTNTGSEYQDYPIVQYPGNHQRFAGCFGAGNRYMYADARGMAHACPFCRKEAGSLLDEPLSDLRNKLKAQGCHAF
jgi:MoaA/NifB/PqqE/SkfB family radical SAM enzyme